MTLKELFARKGKKRPYQLRHRTSRYTFLDWIFSVCRISLWNKLLFWRHEIFTFFYNTVA